ncbi:exopolygalacturonase-like [Benincasa hispida]|uniref:exopolygalacturonase-like n=1 Tax=Benincasa hispida TaxID=102211 RepID=UPI0018FF87CD|nr:exopolygalacturonase-like [Benincasa hispida]
MGLMLNLVVLFSISLFVSLGKGQSNDSVFDVTKYGAMPNTDISQALTNVWTMACGSTSQSKVLIPEGTYQLSIIKLTGPCKNHIQIQLEGILEAPINLIGEHWISFQYIDQFTLTGTGVFDGQGKVAWGKNDCAKNSKCSKLPINLRFNFITNSIVSDITSKDSKSFHVNVLGCKNLTFQHVNINAPGYSPNTDGIHITRSIGINVTNTNISTGDDCISLGDGSRQVTITNITCGPGHGISVGSLGKYVAEAPVQGVIAKNCTLINTTNGVRIKTWPSSPSFGTASDMHFEDIIMVNVSNPIIIDQKYCPWNQCDKTNPSKVKISDVSFKNIRGTAANALAVNFVCSSQFPCEDIEVADINLTYNGSGGPISSQCKNVKPIFSGIQSPPACSSPSSTAKALA